MGLSQQDIEQEGTEETEFSSHYLPHLPLLSLCPPVQTVLQQSRVWRNAKPTGRVQKSGYICYGRNGGPIAFQGLFPTVAAAARAAHRA